MNDGGKRQKRVIQVGDKEQSGVVAFSSTTCRTMYHSSHTYKAVMAGPYEHGIARKDSSHILMRTVCDQSHFYDATFQQFFFFASLETIRATSSHSRLPSKLPSLRDCIPTICLSSISSSELRQSPTLSLKRLKGPYRYGAAN
jgi:hypothetical protein